MFCTKCGKSVDENVKFCPGCGSSIEASASTTPIGENNGGKSLLKLGKVAGIAFCVIVGVVIAYFRHTKAYAINSSENLSVIAKLVTESIASNDELKTVAKVRECTSVSLDMNAPMDSLVDGHVRKVYKGLANVEMFPRKSSWESNDNIEYAESAITVRYDIMVVDAGKEIVLKSAEMRDSDWQALVLSTATGKSGESDDDDNDGDKDDKPSKQVRSSQGDDSQNTSSLSTLTGADIVRESEKKPNGFSNAQIKGLQKKLAGRRLTFEDGKVEGVYKCSDYSAYGVNIVASFKSFSVDAYFPKSEAARLIETVDEGARIKSLEGRVMYPVHMATMLTLADAKIIISE